MNISKISKRVKSLIEFQIKISDAKCTVTHPNCLIRELHHALWKRVVKAFKIEVDFQFTTNRLYLFIKFLLKVKMARPTGCEQKNNLYYRKMCMFKLSNFPALGREQNACFTGLQAYMKRCVKIEFYLDYIILLSIKLHQNIHLGILQSLQSRKSFKCLVDTLLTPTRKVSTYEGICLYQEWGKSLLVLAI